MDGRESNLGKYRLLAELGRGGMAKVFLALVRGPAGFHKLVVIKQIQAALAEDPEFVSMFLDEARLAARLNHPNVVQTNEVGKDGNSYFIAMEYLEGQTLNRVASKLGSGLGLGMALRVASEALAGLHHAHELCDFDGRSLGVVHRDVSPHNIFVTYSGQVKVVDFGIAKALDSSSETRTGVLKGKVAYMAPEQALGETVDRRADLFSMGVVLWQMVTGKRMFRGLPDVAVVQRLASGQIPSLREAAPSVPARLEAIIRKALAPRRDERYPSASELQSDLDAFIATLDDRRSVRDLGKLLGERFADERAQIHAIIEQQVRAADAAADEELPLLQIGPVSESGPSSRVAPSARTRADSLTPSRSGAFDVGGPRSSREVGSAGSLVVEGETRVSRGVRRSRKPLVLGSVAAAFTAAGIVVLLQTKRVEEPAPAASTPGAAVPATHVLRIESEPSGASVTEKGGVLGRTPLEIVVTEGAPGRSFMVSLPGYEAREVAPGALTSDHTAAAMLMPLVRASASASASGSGSASASGSVAVRAPYVPYVAVPRPPPAGPTAATVNTVPEIRMKR